MSRFNHRIYFHQQSTGKWCPAHTDQAIRFGAQLTSISLPLEGNPETGPITVTFDPEAKVPNSFLVE